jgi:carboxymethylenebutenolidase
MVITTHVDVPTPDGTADAFLARPNEPCTYPAVLLLMDAIGLRATIEDMAERLAGHGYVVLAPNLFYRSGPARALPNIVELMATGDRQAMWEAIGPMRALLTPDAQTSDAAAYLDALDADDHTAAGPAGVVGYCMGGAMAIRVAGELPARVAAAGCFHGGNLATEDDDSPHLAARSAQAELYFGHADNDHSLPLEQITRLDHALVEAGVTFTADVYEDAPHGYTMRDMPAYREDAAERHWAALVDLFDRVLHRHAPAGAGAADGAGA